MWFKNLISSSKLASSKRVAGLTCIIISIVMMFSGYTPEYYQPFLYSGSGLLGSGVIDHFSNSQL